MYLVLMMIPFTDSLLFQHQLAVTASTTTMAILWRRVAAANRACATTTSIPTCQAAVTPTLESASSVSSTQRDSAVNTVWLATTGMLRSRAVDVS